MDDLLSLLEKISETTPRPWRLACREVRTALQREVDQAATSSAQYEDRFVRIWRLVAEPRFKRSLDAYYYPETSVDTGRIQKNLLVLLASAATASECNRALAQKGIVSNSDWNTVPSAVPDFLRADYENRFDMTNNPKLRQWTIYWLGEMSPPDHSVTVPAVAVTSHGCLCDFFFDRREQADAALVEDPTVALRPFSKGLLSLMDFQYSKRAAGIHVVWKFEFRPDQRAGPETPVDGDSFGAGIAAGLELLASGRRFDSRSILTASVKPNDGLTSVFLIDKKLAAIPRSHRVGLAHNQPKEEVGSFEQTLEIHRLATVQEAVAFALGSPVPGMGRQTAKLKRYLVGKNPRARAEAAEAAAKAGEIELLNEALCHRSEEVRIAAAEAVCRFKVVAALPCLVSGLRGNGKRIETALIPGLAAERNEPRSPGKNWIWQFGQQAIGPLMDEILRRSINPDERSRFATGITGCLDSSGASRLLRDERLNGAEPQAMCVIEAALRSGVDLARADIEPRLAAINCDAAGLVNYNTAYPAQVSASLLESSIRNETWAHEIVKSWVRAVFLRRNSANFIAEDLLIRSALEMAAVTRRNLLDLADEIDRMDFPYAKGRVEKLRGVAGGDATSTPPKFQQDLGVEPADAEPSEQDIRRADPSDLAFTELKVKLSDTWPSFLEWLSGRLTDMRLVSMGEDQGRENSFYHSGTPGQIHYPINVLCDGFGAPITLEIDLVAEWLHPFVLSSVGDHAGVPWDSSLFPVKQPGTEIESRIEEPYGCLRDAEYWVLFATPRNLHGLQSTAFSRSASGGTAPSARSSDARSRSGGASTRNNRGHTLATATPTPILSNGRISLAAIQHEHGAPIERIQIISWFGETELSVHLEPHTDETEAERRAISLTDTLNGSRWSREIVATGVNMIMASVFAIDDRPLHIGFDVEFTSGVYQERPHADISFGYDRPVDDLVPRDGRVRNFWIEVYQRKLLISLMDERGWSFPPLSEVTIDWGGLGDGAMKVASAFGLHFKGRGEHPFYKAERGEDPQIFIPLLVGNPGATGKDTTGREPVADPPNGWLAYLKNHGATPWTARSIRLGLRFLALEQAANRITLSVGFTSALRDIVNEITSDTLDDVFDKLPILCVRALLRVHPGGEAPQEDIVYLSNQIFEPVLAASLDVAASYDLLAGGSEGGYVLSADFKEEFVDAFLAEETTRQNRRAACAHALLHVCEAAALAKGDSHPSNAKMAMLGLGIYMKGTGMLESYRVSEAQGSDQNTQTGAVAERQEPGSAPTGLSDRLRDVQMEIVCAAVQEIIESTNEDVEEDVLEALRDLILTRTDDLPLLAVHAFVHLGRGPLKRTVYDILQGLSRSGLSYTKAAASYALGQIEGPK